MLFHHPHKRSMKGKLVSNWALPKSLGVTLSEEHPYIAKIEDTDLSYETRHFVISVYWFCHEDLRYRGTVREFFVEDLVVLK